PIGFPAVLFIGVKNDGQVYPSMKAQDLDSLQKTLADQMKQVFPTVYWVSKLLLDEHHLPYLAVIVAGSENSPHFSGPAYVRVGSQTVDGSVDQFNKLIAERQSKTYWITQLIGKECSYRYGMQQELHIAKVLACNQFYMTCESD